MPALVLDIIIILAAIYEQKTADFNALFDNPPKAMSPGRM